MARRASSKAATAIRTSFIVEHRESYKAARFVLADEVGVGKTLSLATAAMVGCLLGDGPALILMTTAPLLVFS